MLTDFENLEPTFERTVGTQQWKTLQTDFNAAEDVYIIGNGGNMSVASHGASDISRLTNKRTYSLDSQSFATSVANDFSYDEMFVKWLSRYATGNTKSLLIGLSGSGNSKSILKALDWANTRYNFSCVLISGQKSIALDPKINEVCFDVKYFHSAEILSLMAVYELIVGCGNACPTIKSEIIRKYGK